MTTKRPTKKLTKKLTKKQQEDLLAEQALSEGIPFDKIKQIVRVTKGYLTIEQGVELYRGVFQAPGPIVEIGAYYGRSTCILSLAAATCNKHLYSIDPWAKVPETPMAAEHFEGIFEKWQTNVGRRGRSAQVTPVRGLSWEVRGQIPDELGMVFIDGDHTWHGIVRDWQEYAESIVVGGQVFVHDTDSPFPYHDAIPTFLKSQVDNNPLWEKVVLVENMLGYRRINPSPTEPRL
jgi:predicted O-methyltransferase YrrM